MEIAYIICGILFLGLIINLILTDFDIRYKGKCIFHDWKYKYELGDYWRYTGTFLESNRRYVCRKCKKTEKI